MEFEEFFEIICVENGLRMESVPEEEHVGDQWAVDHHEPVPEGPLLVELNPVDLGAVDDHDPVPEGPLLVELLDDHGNEELTVNPIVFIDPECNVVDRSQWVQARASHH